MGQAILASTNSNQEIILFNSDTGQDLKVNNTIVLTNTMDNYNVIKIYYMAKTGYTPGCLEFLTKNIVYGAVGGSGISPSSIVTGLSNSYIKIASARGTVSTDKKTITFDRNCTMEIKSSGVVTIDSEQGIIIYKIIGLI